MVPPSGSSEGSPQSAGTLLLVVDDVQTFARFRDHLLSRPGGFQVQQTSSVESALARLRNSCDVALVDLDLPEAAGRDVLHRIHRAAEAVPIVLLVDVADAGLIDEALSLGIQDCLPRSESDPARVYQVLQNAMVRHGKLLELKQERVFEHHVATHDPLTLLWNRQAFVSGLDNSLALARRRSSRLAVLFFDLDGFKAVNDGFGHGAGDALLAEVGRRMRGVTRKSDMVARFGGDEFVVALNDIDGPRSVMRAAEQFIEMLSKPIVVGDQEHQIGVSIGVSIYPEDSESAEELIRAADLAMYSAKQTFGSCVRFYQSEMDRHVHTRFALVADVRTSILEEQYFLEFQPQVDIVRHQLVGAEALLRWMHPERGRLAPAEFLSIAEDTGMIRDVGRWVLDEACRTAADWGGGDGAPRIAVNVSHYQVQDASFLDDVVRALRSSGLAPDRLVLEMTEEGLGLETGHVRSVLEEVHRLGVQIAVDRFGVGVGSLTLLQWPYLHMLKIDRSLVQDVGRDTRTGQIVGSLVSMAERLDLGLVAEGVESGEQVKALRALGCACMQGFALGEPVSSEQFAQYRSRRWRWPGWGKSQSA